MKVTFLAGTLGRGGAERQLVYMLRSLMGNGVNPRLLCLTKGEALEEEIRDLGIDVRPIDTRRGRIATLRGVIRELRRESTDIVQSSHFYTNIYAAVSGRIIGTESIGAIRSDLDYELAANGIYGRYQLTLPKHLIANSERAIKRSIAFGIKKQKIDLVRNVVAFGNGLEHPNDNSSGTTNIAFVGRLGKEKRPELFVKLAYELKKTVREQRLKFQIVGDGPLRPELETLAAEYGLSAETLCFSGERSDMSAVYSSLDILVLTSKHEGTPNVILEALSNAVPVVATDVGGVSEVLSDQMGILVDPMDFDGLVGAVKHLIASQQLRQTLGTNGQKYVAENHSLNYLGGRLTEIYNSLLPRQ